MVVYLGTVFVNSRKIFLGGNISLFNYLSTDKIKYIGEQIIKVKNNNYPLNYDIDFTQNNILAKGRIVNSEIDKAGNIFLRQSTKKEIADSNFLVVPGIESDHADVISLISLGKEINSVSESLGGIYLGPAIALCTVNKGYI